SFIDWGPFFWSWELKGPFPKILEHPKYGEQARELFKDGKFYLEKILKNKIFKPKAIYQFFEAYRDGDDVKLFSGGELVEIFHFLRQQKEKAANGSPATYHCLADYVAPKGVKDHMGAFVVTMGQEVEDYAKALEADGDEFGAIMVKVLGDRMAEACT